MYVIREREVESGRSEGEDRKLSGREGGGDKDNDFVCLGRLDKAIGRVCAEVEKSR